MHVPFTLDPLPNGVLPSAELPIKFDYSNRMGYNPDASYGRYLDALNGKEQHAGIMDGSNGIVLNFGFYGVEQLTFFLMDADSAEKLKNASSNGYVDFAGTCTVAWVDFGAGNKLGCAMYNGEFTAGSVHVLFSPYPQALELLK